MSSLTKKLQFISDWEKDLVFGYCRHIQKSLRSLQIPMAISRLCLVYHHEYDFFNHCSKDIEINAQKDSVIRLNHNMWDQRVYGLMNIIKGKLGLTYVWKFKITGEWSFHPPSIGIIQIHPPKHIEFYDANNIFYVDDNWESNLYSYWFSVIATGDKVTNMSKRGYRVSSYEYMSAFGDGDIVKMEINTNHGTIQFHVNDENQGIAFDNIDFSINKYRLRIRLGDNGYSMRLIEFTTKKLDY